MPEWENIGTFHRKRPGKTPYRDKERTRQEYIGERVGSRFRHYD